MNIIDLPEQDQSIKVVQMYADNKPVLLCGPDTDFHAYILQKYLSQSGIPFTVADTNPRGQVMPALNGDRYQVVGMGNTVVFPSIKTMRTPGGESADYDLGVSQEFNERIKQVLKDWFIL